MPNNLNWISHIKERVKGTEKIQQENTIIIEYLKFREQHFRHILWKIRKLYQDGSTPHGISILQHNIYSVLDKISDLNKQIQRAEEMMSQGVHVIKGFFQQDFDTIEESIRQIDFALKTSRNPEIPQIAHQALNISQAENIHTPWEKIQALLRYIGNPQNFREYVNRIERIKTGIESRQSNDSWINIQQDIQNLNGDPTILDRFRKRTLSLINAVNILDRSDVRDDTEMKSKIYADLYNLTQSANDESYGNSVKNLENLDLKQWDISITVIAKEQSRRSFVITNLSPFPWKEWMFSATMTVKNRRWEVYEQKIVIDQRRFWIDRESIYFEQVGNTWKKASITPLNIQYEYMNDVSNKIPENQKDELKQKPSFLKKLWSTATSLWNKLKSR